MCELSSFCLGCTCFDVTSPTIDLTQFKECDWKYFYPQARGKIPGNAPNPPGKDVDLMIFVDSNHADDSVTKRSRTGFFIFLNMAPMSWYSKKQTTIETSIFGAEFVAMKVVMKTARGL